MIKDSQLTASSVWMGISTFGPQRARLNSNKWPQGWSASIKDQNPWLKVNLGSNHVITAIATQGYGNAIFNEWVESYYISWLDKMAGDVMYEEEGNVKVRRSVPFGYPSSSLPCNATEADRQTKTH